MSIRVTLSANAGVAIEIGGIRIWVDALHDVQVPGFSTLRAQRLRQLWTAEAFQSPDVIVYTHCHPDHYSQQLTAEAHLRWPKARLILPQKEFAEQELVSGDGYTAVVEDVVLHFCRLPHESQHYTIDVPHYGLTITHGTEAILLPGDCAVASPALLPLIARQHFRLALLNFPWITLGRAGNLSSSIYSLTISSSTIFRLRRTTRSISALQRCPKRSGCTHILDDFLQAATIP